METGELINFASLLAPIAMTTAQVMAYEPDLLFSSKIESAAARVGLSVKIVRNLDELIMGLKEAFPQIVFVNLDATEGRLAFLRELARKRTCKVVGYYSHVNASLAEEARQVGIDSVVSRGAFVTRLPEIFAAVRSGG